MKNFLLIFWVSIPYQLFSQHHSPIINKNPYYNIENISTPAGLSAETGGMDFLPNGKLIACFHRGEVMTYDPKIKEWKLFASGLHDPLGILALSDSEVLIMQRPELTKISDTNGDDSADKFETVTDAFGMSGNYHEFAFGPKKDKDGNIYFALNLASNGAGIQKEVRGRYDSLGRLGRMYSCVPYRGWVMKLAPDGKLETFASGFRSPNTLGFDSEGRLFVSDNQGDWLGTSKLYHVQKDKFYGHPSSLVWDPAFHINPLSLDVSALDSLRTKESVLFPHGNMANSPTEPACDITNGKFGPFENQLFVGEMNQGRIMRLMLEEIGGEIQGACIPFLGLEDGLKRGNNRLVFGPDGSLWVGQTDHGWTGSKGIQKISFAGKQPIEILKMNLTVTGFTLTFTEPVNPATIRAENFIFKRYYYEYHQAYGSNQMDIKPVQVKNISISRDKRKVSIDLTELKRGYVYELNTSGVKGKNQKLLNNRLVCYTLNQLLQK